MKKTQSYNSLLVIATLSVYLGLVITGASPQVLAQAAANTAKTQKSLSPKRDEVSVPDVSKLEDFLGEIGSLVESGKLDIKQPLHVQIQAAFDSGDITQGSLKFSTDSSKPVILGLLKEFSLALDESRLFSVIANSKRGEKIIGADLDLKLSEDDVSFSATFKSDSPQTAKNIANRFSGIFKLVAAYRKGYPESDFYRDAQITFKENQTFIVTRMPRASLEDYLKSAAARAGK